MKKVILSQKKKKKINPKTIEDGATFPSGSRSQRFETRISRPLARGSISLISINDDSRTLVEFEGKKETRRLYLSSSRYPTRKEEVEGRKIQRRFPINRPWWEISPGRKSKSDQEDVQPSDHDFNVSWLFPLHIYTYVCVCVCEAMLSRWRNGAIKFSKITPLKFFEVIMIH